MVKQTSLALNDAAEWLGDWHPLAEQLGSADGLLTLGCISSELRLPPVQDTSSLECALREYQVQILLPVELPAIQAAHGHASRNELRELVTLDQELSREPRLQRFAPASRRVGQAQLQKLRPLRDQRIVKRYLPRGRRWPRSRLAHSGVWVDTGDLFPRAEARSPGIRSPGHSRVHLLGRADAAALRAAMSRPL